MNCEFCMESFNDTTNKPLIIINCGHTICSKCEKNANKKCPTCKSIIERTLFNSIVLTSNKESNSLVLEPVAKSKYFINIIINSKNNFFI